MRALTRRRLYGLRFGHTGITSGVFNSGGGLHQHYSTELQNWSPTLDLSYATAIDTHFLDITANMASVTLPTELERMTSAPVQRRPTPQPRRFAPARRAQTG